MSLFVDNVVADLIILITTLAVVIFTYFHFAYKYWEKKNAPFLPPKFPLGNSPSLITKNESFGLESIKFYEEIKKKGYKFAGIYIVTRPVLVVIDPDYIRDVLSKDFSYFVDRGFYHNEKDDPLSAHLFALDDTKWKNMRVKLTPTFTSGKMKIMFQTVLDCSDYMIEAMEKWAMEKKDIDAKECLSRFTTDVIGACAFGINCNSFKHPDAEFRKMGQTIFKVDLFLMLKAIFITKFPKLAIKLGCKTTHNEVSKFFFDVIEKSVKYREDNKISRPDFLQLLIDLKEATKSTEEPFTMKQLVAQVFLFFIAGFDTSSSAMNFTLYELSRNPDIQEKVRDEITEVLEMHGGKITYESIMDMKYLQQVLEETLRMYPPVPNLTRKCVKDYTLRDTNITIEKGTEVLIPLLPLHRDPDYYPDPEKFDPERFTSENKNSRHAYTHMPFGEGPRNCIGLRFGLMQAKIGLIRILKKFRVSISPTTKMPLHLDPNVFLLQSAEPLYLKVDKL